VKQRLEDGRYLFCGVVDCMVLGYKARKQFQYLELLEQKWKLERLRSHSKY
jgi:hypothetical protein